MRHPLSGYRLGTTLAKSLLIVGLCATPAGAEDQGDRDITYGMYSGLALLFDVHVPETPNGYGSRQMADGKQWTTDNLNVETGASYCHGDAEANCRRYGRLYTWEAAQHGCRALGDGWRLPTNDEWRQMAKYYGGVRDDSDDTGKSAYAALMDGGSSGFNALLGGNRSLSAQYERLEAHGFYWTSSESDAANAWFYNFGKGGQALNRHRDGEKWSAFSVRCVRE